MSNIENAVQNYREAAQTLLSRADMLEAAAGSVDAATALQHREDATTFAMLTETWDAENFVTTGADVRGTIRDLSEVLASRRAA